MFHIDVQCFLTRIIFGIIFLVNFDVKENSEIIMTTFDVSFNDPKYKF